MKTVKLRSTLVSIVLAVFAASVATGSGSSDFEALKALAGDWVMLENGQPGKTVMLSYRVTAGGTAVVETVMPGGDHEMVTVYHRDGDDLVLTHYCGHGNQPHMRAKAGSAAGTLVFECEGGTNIPSEDAAHMHRATIKLLGADRLQSEWVGYADGKPMHTASFDVVRKK